jgi:hypothetical protein
VGCSHAAGSPLFPLLNASLQGWRDYYCDSGDRWRDCARYKLSLTGERVPITLLPNGHHALHLGHAADADRSGVAQPGQAPPQGPPSRPDPESPATAILFEPAPAPAPARHHQPSPLTLTPQPQDGRARRTRQVPGSKGGLWARLVDWMSGPA